MSADHSDPRGSRAATPVAADTPYGAYRFTSIARPVEPRFPTNRAVLRLLPIAAGIGAGITLYRDGDPVAAVLAALMFALVAFGGWALTRELAPDDNAAAFIAIPLAVGSLFAGADSVLLVFIAMFLSRIVNRSTGLGPRVIDSAAITGLIVWATGALEQPLLGVVASIAFALDALLAEGRRWQLLPAAACAATSANAIYGGGLPVTLDTPTPAQAMVVGVVCSAYLASVYRSRRVTSVGDVYGLPLTPARVQAGMLVTLLLALQAMLVSAATPLIAAPIWASIIAVPLGFLLSSLTGTPSARSGES